jgi:hypothetical protein
MSVSGHGAPKVRTSRLKQLVYTYLEGGRIAGNDGVFDSKGPACSTVKNTRLHYFTRRVIVDGSSQLHRVRRQRGMVLVSECGQ